MSHEVPEGFVGNQDANIPLPSNDHLKTVVVSIEGKINDRRSILGSARENHS